MNVYNPDFSARGHSGITRSIPILLPDRKKEQRNHPRFADLARGLMLYEIVKSKRSTIEVNVILSGIFLNPLNLVFRMEKIKWNANQFH